MSREKSVQLPASLFGELVKWFIFEERDHQREERIKGGLLAKFEAMERREMYTAYKTEEDAAKREAARQKYLDAKGIPEDFRWSTGVDSPEMQ